MTEIFFDLILFKTHEFTSLYAETSWTEISDRSFNSEIKKNNLSINKVVITIAKTKSTIITGPPLSKKSNRDVNGRAK